jgi:hypothetical protein
MSGTGNPAVHPKGRSAFVPQGGLCVSGPPPERSPHLAPEISPRPPFYARKAPLLGSIFGKACRTLDCGTVGRLARWETSRSPIPSPPARPVTQGVVANGYALFILGRVAALILLRFFGSHFWNSRIFEGTQSDSDCHRPAPRGSLVPLAEIKQKSAQLSLPGRLKVRSRLSNEQQQKLSVATTA